MFPVFRKCDDGHDFRSGGDDETSVVASAVFFAVERNGDAAQRAIVHVERALPGDAMGIEIQIVAVEKMRIDERGKQIMGRGDGVKIAVKMEIDFRAGLDLRKAATRGAAFYSKNGAERRLARGNDDFLADVREALGEADGGDSLPFSRGRGRGCGNEDQFPAALEGGIGEQLQLDFSAL